MLLASAHEGQRRVGLAASADLLRERAADALGLSRSPRPVRNAVRLMCLGAVLTLALLVTVLVTLGRRDRRDGALAGRAGGGAHLQRGSQPVLPAETCQAVACADLAPPQQTRRR